MCVFRELADRVDFSTSNNMIRSMREMTLTRKKMRWWRERNPKKISAIPINRFNGDINDPDIKEMFIFLFFASSIFYIYFYEQIFCPRDRKSWDTVAVFSRQS